MYRQENMTNTKYNKTDPQKKHRLGMVSKKSCHRRRNIEVRDGRSNWIFNEVKIQFVINLLYQTKAHARIHFVKPAYKTFITILIVLRHA